MGAQARFRFENGFLLDEEKLRKIHDIISKRVEGEVKFSVKREDSFSFVTTKIDDIIHEENLKGSRIKELRIKLDKKNLDLDIRFDDSGAVLDLNGEDRDTVLLLNSDLKDYMSNGVCTVKVVHNLEIYLFLLGFLVFLGTFFYSSKRVENKLSDDIVKNALESNNTNEKINILIRELSLSSKTDGIEINLGLYYGILYIIGIIFVVMSLKYSDSISSWLFSHNLFLFGKESERYEKHLEFKKNVTWVVVAGLLISIIGGLIVWALTLNRA